MQREQTYPPGRVDSILVWVMPRFRDTIRNIMNGDDPVEHDDHNKEQEK
jgi:hypothetical protein